MLPRRTGAILLSTATLLAISAASLRGEGEKEASGKIRDDFESPRPAWRQEQTDATITLQAHERSKRAAHEGRTSERFQFVAGVGSSFFYSYPLPKVPVTDALRTDLYVRSNRAGIRLFARVVLPADTDPDTKQPSFVLVPGTSYEQVDRWQRLELSNLRPSIERQARVLRAATRRPVSLQGAYLEQLVVNLFGGEGESEVFLDDLTVAPVPGEAVAEHQRPAEAAPAAPDIEAPKAKPDPKGPVRLSRNRLGRIGPDGRAYDWFFTAIHAPGVDVVKLRQAGFDVLAEDIDADPKRIEEATKAGFLLMPNLDATLEGRPIGADRMVAEATNYPFRDSVAFWNIGERLGRSPNPRVRKAELDRIRATIAGLRSLPDGVSKLTTATVDGDLPLYANPPRNLSIMGVRPNLWGSAQEPMDTYQFLKQRRDLTALANAECPYFAWIPLTPPPAVATAIWGYDKPPAWGVPQVLPEQLRLFTYIALGAGYRGLGYWSDTKLTGSAAQENLIELAFLNEEVDLCQSILAQASDPYPLHGTFLPDPPTIPNPGSRINMRMPVVKEKGPTEWIRAAGITLPQRKGVLLLVADYDAIGQFQPTQMANPDLKVTVPVPESALAFEVSPGDVRPLDLERVPGGTRISVTDFGPTSLILVTTDIALVERIRDALTKVRPLAVQLAIEQAELRLQQVMTINDLLIKRGRRLHDKTDKTKNQPLPEGSPEPDDEGDLIRKAGESIKAAREAQEREDYPLAWSEARRSSRSARHLMFAQWQKGYEAMLKQVVPEDPKPPPTRLGRLSPRDNVALERERRRRTPYLVSPVMCPPLVSYNTLPLSDYWTYWISKPFGPNLVPSGKFDDQDEVQAAGWVNQSHLLDGITGKAQIATDEQNPGKVLLKLTVEPTDETKLDASAPYLDFPAAAIRSPGVRMERDQLFRISVLVKMLNPVPRGAGGIIVTDSIGGETLQYRSSLSIPKLSRLVLFRRAPSKGILTVTLGLAGFGEAYFDDFRIERVEDVPGGALDDVAGRPAPPPPVATIPLEELPPATATRPLPRTRPSR